MEVRKEVGGEGGRRAGLEGEDCAEQRQQPGSRDISSPPLGSRRARQPATAVAAAGMGSWA